MDKKIMSNIGPTVGFRMVQTINLSKVMTCLTPSIVYKNVGKYFLTFVLRCSALKGRVHPPPPPTFSKNKKIRFGRTPPFTLS